ncbi:MAG: TolC family protein, partial [Gammaproteobacteria bacterium]|nr:TolC family protein [Gammaproteobacteria bacterium]
MNEGAAVSGLLRAGLGSGLLLVSWSLQALELDFAAALARLEAESEVLQAADEGLARARAGVDEARGRRGPTVTLDARATRLDAPLEADLAPVRDLLGGALGGAGITLPPEFFPDAFRLQERQFYTLGLEAVQPLYVGGRIRAGLEVAASGVEAERSAVEATRGELHRVLTERYFGQVLAAEALAVREQTVAALQRHVDDAARLEAEGLIARAERLRAGVALAEALAERDTARAQFSLAPPPRGAQLAPAPPGGGGAPPP